MATKQVVLDFLKHDRSLLSARNLYNQFPNKNLAIQSYIAKLPYSVKNLRVVCYELCKLVDVSERQMNALLNQPISIKPIAKVIELPTEPSLEQMEARLLAFTKDVNEEEIELLRNFLNIEFKIPDFSKGLPGTQERKKLAETLNIEVLGKKHKDYDDAFELYCKNSVLEAIDAAKQALIDVKLQELDIATKESIKLRDQFPFLKNQDCPRVLHLLVADLITAHEEFIAKQPLLHEAATQEQLKKLVADVKASYITKKEIFEELDYYHKNESLLGEHPLFEKLAQEEALKKLDAVELAKKISNLTSNINRNKNKRKAAESDSDKEKYQSLIDRDVELKDFVEKELLNRK